MDSPCALLALPRWDCTLGSAPVVPYRRLERAQAAPERAAGALPMPGALVNACTRISRPSLTVDRHAPRGAGSCAVQPPLDYHAAAIREPGGPKHARRRQARPIARRHAGQSPISGMAQRAAGIRQLGRIRRGACDHSRLCVRACALPLSHTLGGPGQGEEDDQYRVQDAKGSQDSLLQRRNGHAGAGCAAIRPRGCDRGGGERRRAGHGTRSDGRLLRSKLGLAQHDSIFGGDSAHP